MGLFAWGGKEINCKQANKLSPKKIHKVAANADALSPLHRECTALPRMWTVPGKRPRCFAHREKFRYGSPLLRNALGSRVLRAVYIRSSITLSTPQGAATASSLQALTQRRHENSRFLLLSLVSSKKNPIRLSYFLMSHLTQGFANVGAVNCNANINKGLCAKYDISGFPTVKLFGGLTLAANGTPLKKTPTDYTGRRDVESLKAEAMKLLINTVTSVSGQEGLDKIRAYAFLLLLQYTSQFYLYHVLVTDLCTHLFLPDETI